MANTVEVYQTPVSNLLLGDTPAGCSQLIIECYGGGGPGGGATSATRYGSGGAAGQLGEKVVQEH